MRKRKSPISKSLIKNSIAGMFSAIEIHNKPTIKYRYEIVVLLVLNSWELLLKGYLYKFHKDIKLILEDGTTKPFDNCLNIVNTKIGKVFNVVQENLSVLYNYRNQIAHFYLSDLDPIVYSLISKNVIFYSRFLVDYFKIDLSNVSDLILLPIGFKKPISPIDYISNASIIKSSSNEVRKFLQSIIDSSQRLYKNGIDETIFVDFKMNLINVNRTVNADLIAGIDNAQENKITFKVFKESKNVIHSNTETKLILTRDKSESQGTLVYEELQEGIFDEINNIIDANQLLSKGRSQFMLGLPLYYRIYAERQHVNFNINRFELLAKTGLMDFYAPFLFWMTRLPADRIVKILLELYEQCKSPKINNLIKMLILYGEEAVQYFNNLLDAKYSRLVQKPDFYYTFLELKRSKKTDPILRVLKASKNSKIEIFNSDKEYTFGDILDNNSLAINQLSQECLNVFNGKISQRSVARDLDFLAYGYEILENRSITEELKKI
jgi:hypothetical protein